MGVKLSTVDERQSSPSQKHASCEALTLRTLSHFPYRPFLRIAVKLSALATREVSAMHLHDMKHVASCSAGHDRAPAP